MVVNTVELPASQCSKMNRPILFWFQTVCSCKTQVTVEKNLSPSLRYELVQLEGNSCSSTSLKKSKVGSTNLWDKLQFVNSVKRLVLDLTKIPFLKRLIGISRLIVEVLNDQNLFTESTLANWFSSYFGSVEKWITVRGIQATWNQTLKTQTWKLIIPTDSFL